MYMRHFITAAVLLLGMGCVSTKKTVLNTYQLNGTRVPVRQEMNGEELPAAIFKTQKLIIQNDTYFFTAESIDKGTLTYSNGKMDIYGKEGVNSGRHFTVIYKLKNEQLIIVYNLKGDSYPASFYTKESPALFLSIYKKE
jgi:uncharacterized protein (TIGR03067 family)